MPLALLADSNLGGPCGERDIIINELTSGYRDTCDFRISKLDSGKDVRG
jgi:hypothetical protein